MYLSLADFYEEKGYFINAPARSYRYEAVLEFVRSLQERSGYSEKICRESESLFRELLTFDLYLRENAKSRPAFARDIRGYYQNISELYKKEEKNPELLLKYAAKGCDSRQMMRMTHVDVFCYPVWDERWIGEAKPGCLQGGEEYFVLFDYETRDPLNRGASYTVIRRAGEQS